MTSVPDGAPVAPAREARADRADTARTRLVEHGMLRALEEGVLGIASLLSPAALARRSGAVSVDTAYRLLGSPAEVLEQVARRVADPDFSSDLLDWPTFDDVSVRAVDAYGGSQATDAGGVGAALRHYLVSNFSLPSYPLSRLLRAVSILASPRWSGSVRLNGEARELAESLHSIDSTAWATGREHMRWLLQDALAAMGRRPRAGQSVEKILLLLYAFAEGATDHLMLHPDLLSPEDVVEAIFELGLALTEDGSLSDPRAPQDPQVRIAFDRLVATADGGWSSGRAFADVRAIAMEAGVAEEAAVLMFASLVDVADSVLRARVISSGADAGATAPTFALLVATLHRIANVADAAPTVSEIALAHRDEMTVFHDVRGLAATVADLSAVPVPVTRVVDEMIANALHGRARWSTVEILLETIEPQ